jgi:flagellar basal body-associated protein FliL
MCSLKLAVVYAIQRLLLLFLLLLLLLVVVMMMMMVHVSITALFSTYASNQHAQSTRSRVQSQVKKESQPFILFG